MIADLPVYLLCLADIPTRTLVRYDFASRPRHELAAEIVRVRADIRECWADYEAASEVHEIQLHLKAACESEDRLAHLRKAAKVSTRIRNEEIEP